MNDFETIWHYPLIQLSSGIEVTVGQISLTLMVILLGLVFIKFLQRLLGRWMTRSDVDPNVAQTIQRVVFWGLLIVLFITALGMLRIPVTALAFISGAVAIGIGFGAQNIINNFISGWILMWERPIRIGDFLELGAMIGSVESINTRFTRVRRIDGVRLMIPNSQLLENTVVNWTIVDRNLRSHVRVGVQYGSDIPKVKQLLDQILADNPDILEEPSPSVIFEDFGDSALIFDAFFWIESAPERSPRGVRSALRFEIARVFKENDVVIAFPQRDIHVDGTLNLEKS